MMTSANSEIHTLKRNTLIILVANLGSRAIGFILAPLYSYYLTQSEYGTMDLITTTVSLLAPIICLDIYEASFRFSSDENYDREKILSSTCLLSTPIFIIAVALTLYALIFNPKGILVAFVCIFTFLDSLDAILTQYLRGINRMKEFAATGVVHAVVLLLSNIVFLILLHQHLKGWLLSFLLAKIVLTGYLFFSTRAFSAIRLRNVDKGYLVTFIKYCLPLMPSAVMWWVMNVSDRYMIAFFVSTAATGVYAVANKIPSVLSIFENIFYQAWQISSINLLKDKERDKFYSNVFNKYFSFLVVGVICILSISREALSILFEKSYSSAWVPMAPLVIALLIHALAGNLGIVYTTFKQTKGAFYTSAIGAITNIALNIILIPKAGILGAAITTIIGYIVTLVVRWNDVKKYVTITLDKEKTVVLSILFLLELIFYYMEGNIFLILRIVIVVISVYYTKDIFFKVLKR